MSFGDPELKTLPTQEPAPGGYAGDWPRPAASAAIFRGTAVLLVARSKPPRVGSWSLPGGKIEPGETAREAARREVVEETGLRVDIEGIVDVHDVVIRGAGGDLTAHYVLAVYFGRCDAGEPVAASDASAARFVSLADLPDYDMTAGAAELIARAARLAGVVGS